MRVFFNYFSYYTTHKIRNNILFQTQIASSTMVGLRMNQKILLKK